MWKIKLGETVCFLKNKSLVLLIGRGATIGRTVHALQERRIIHTKCDLNVVIGTTGADFSLA